MWQINLLSGIFLFILGFIIKKFKIAYLIAGYNTSSKKEKAKYDKEKLVEGVGNFLMMSSEILILGGLLAIIFKSVAEKIVLISWILFTACMIFWVVYVNVKGIFLKKS